MEDLIKTLCGNHEIYANIACWLRDFNYSSRISEHSCIILAGPPCIGKTYSIKHICSYLNCCVTNIDHSVCVNMVQLKDIIFKTASSSLLQILADASNKKVIVIDNFDAMFIADKTITNGLLKILTDKKMKNIPIICIAHNDMLKNMGDIKKICKTHRLCAPTLEEVNDVLAGRALSARYVKELYDSNSGNLQKIFEAVENSLVSYDKGDTYDDVNILYGTSFDRHNIRRIVDVDAWLIPLRFHENLIIELDNRTSALCRKKEFYKVYMEIMCTYNMFMSKNYPEIAGDVFLCAVSLLSALRYKKVKHTSIGNFTKILSFLSLQKKNMKTAYNSSFPLYQISNYHVNLCNRKFVCFY